MNDERLAELKEKYKDRNLLEELVWGIYANHSGYTSKQNGEFLNWLCLMAYSTLKERPQGEWIKEPNGKTTDIYRCSVCKRSIMLCKGADLGNYPFCHCGAKMKGDVK